MNNRNLKVFIILLFILPVEFVGYFVMSNHEKKQLKEQFKLKMEIEKLNAEKEKKNLIDEFEKNRYLATGKDAYERIYNNKQKDVVDLIQKLALESFPSNWKLEVKVEEFTNTILLIQVDTNITEYEVDEIAKRLIPVLNYSEKYLKNVAIYNSKHQCYLFFDENILTELIKIHTLSEETITDIRNKGVAFTRYNAIKIDFQEKSGHFFIPVVVSGAYGSYECIMMLDTGASMTVISLELAQKTGNEDLNNMPRETFSTANGFISCPIVERELFVEGIDKRQPVAVSLSGDTNLLGVDFFKSKNYIIDHYCPIISRITSIDYENHHFLFCSRFP